MKIAAAGRLYLIDPRKFGEVYLFSKKEGHTTIDPFSLGPEPLLKSFTPEVLERSLKKSRSVIKT
ncbi:unnamed protein product, partial [marine sediment metagenome]